MHPPAPSMGRSPATSWSGSGARWPPPRWPPPWSAPTGAFLKVNAALCALVGHPEGALLAGEATGYQLRQRCRRVDGEAISVLCNTWLATDGRGHRLHLDADGRPRYLVRQLVDLREGRHPEDQLAWRATHDALTGLPNRSLFLDRLEMTLARLGREPALAAVLVLDLDRFREVAERVGDDAVDSASIGIALTGSGARRAEALLSDADTAMAPAKQRRGGLYELFDEMVRAQLIERLELERALARRSRPTSCAPSTSRSSRSRRAAWSGWRPWSAGTSRVGASCRRPSSCPSPRRPA